MGTIETAISIAGEMKYTFFPAPLASLSNETLEVDLYLVHGEGREPALYRGSGLPFTPHDAVRLAETGVKYVYIPLAQHGAYRRMLMSTTERLFADKGVAVKERGKIVRATCSKIIEDVLMFPGWPEAVDAVEEISVCFTRWAEEAQHEFSYVLDMTAHDFYTTTHMVNVGVGCGMLAKELRPGDADFLKLVFEGGLLHDLGKRGVPEEILNKEGKLTDEEWAVLKVHPAKGYDELRDREGVSAVVLEMTRDHHEKLDGSGYPNGLKGDQISFHARLCGVVDIYDALTTARPYRGPIPPMKALSMMREEAGPKLDPDIFEAWEALVHKLLRDDPARAVGGRAGSIATVTAAPRADEPRKHTGDEKRGHPRRVCRLRGEACFEYRGKQVGPEVGEWYPVNIVDISQSGLGLRFEFAPSKGDLIRVRIPQPSGRPLEREGEIVRVRQDPGGAYLVGMRFTRLMSSAA